MGGVAALIAIQQLGAPTSDDMYLMTATDQLLADCAVIIPGGIGLIADSLIISTCTQLASPQRFWIRLKWALAIVLVVLGAGFMGNLVEANMTYTANAIAQGTFDSSVYRWNVNAVSIAGVIQLALFLLCMHVGITKPSGRRKGKVK